VIIWLLLPILAFIALLIAASLGAFGLTLDKTIKISDFSPLFGTTVVAVFLQYIFLRKTKTKDIEKDLLGGQIEAVLDLMFAVRKSLSATLGRRPSIDEARDIVVAFEDCGDALSSLESTVENSHCSELHESCKAVGDVFLRYKNIITGRNFPYDPLTNRELDRTSALRREIGNRLRMLSLQIAKQ